MRKYLLLIISALLSSSIFAQRELVSYVNPLNIDAQNKTVFHGATSPFGIIQLGPYKGGQESVSLGGHSQIIGFGHWPLSETSIRNSLNISLMPLPSPFGGDTVQPVPFSQRDEIATPGFYSVRLGNGITAQLTATNRVGYYKYQFPSQSEPTILFDLNLHERDVAIETHIKRLDDSTLVGYRYSKEEIGVQRIYFAAKTSRVIKDFSIKGELNVELGDISVGLTSSYGESGLSSQLVFDYTEIPESVELKIALSRTGIEDALTALAEIPQWNFNEIKRDAASAWETELRKINISTNDEDLKRVFYTSLYNTVLNTTHYSNTSGKFQNRQDDIHNSIQSDSLFNPLLLSDTFGSLNPLFTLIQQKKHTNYLNSLLKFYNKRGSLPARELNVTEVEERLRYDAVPVVSDAILKDWPGFDKMKAYKAMKEASQKWSQSLLDYIQYGYVPQDRHKASVSLTLEYAYNDWCLANVARKLGETADYELFLKRSESYKNLIDINTGYIRAKNSNGSWAGSSDSNTFAIHDILGFIEQVGQERFENQLDKLFSADSLTSFTRLQTDDERLNHYFYDNPSFHHVPYLYSFIGKPWKSHRIIREIIGHMYADSPAETGGNVSNAQMGAWAVWNIIGLYPVNPTGGVYMIGSPMVGAASLNLADAKKLEIEVLNNAPDNLYVQSVKWNGSVYRKNYFMHKDIVDGGKISFVMGPEPSANWGVGDSWLPSTLSPEKSHQAKEPKKSIFDRLSDFFENLF